MVFAIALAVAACSGEDPGVPRAPDGAPLLLTVAEQGDLTTLDDLLARRQILVDVRDSCDWTPLMKAALNGHLEAAARLIMAGAAIDAEDSGGYTALMLAASNNHRTVVEYLLAEGAMVDHQESTQGVTALIWAAKLGHRETLGTLIDGGADITLRDFSGRRAADWAAENGFDEIAAWLAAHHPDEAG
ncbi:ankyrin repeat domain-containing protein [Thioalkalicoccus limnaeus]|uniref:Ankyrin repeat domain-containing protein n=1 Tax=Thioalkalicoccus limnaeus TaxID=120681 RepID=A0ABV4BGL1_9GAMM